jgi:polyhydroxybutyrate depolymerase
MSQMLACKQADVFAAAAVAGSTLTIADSLTAAESACTPSRPIPIFMINGTADPLVGYTAVAFSGGLTVTDDYTLWTTVDKCTGSPEQTLQKGQITCKTYNKCGDNVEVTQCVAEGMGHCMPGMKTESDTNCLTKVAYDVLPIQLGAPNNDIDGVQMSFDFLKRWSLP